MIFILKITKQERDAIIKKIPKACVVVANRQSNHKKYYIEETIAVLKMIKKLRGEWIPKPKYNKKKKGGVKNEHHK